MDERTMKQLEAYLDGLLPEGELKAFERRLDADDELRQAVSQQREIDQSMRRLMATSAECDEVLKRALDAAASGTALGDQSPHRHFATSPHQAAIKFSARSSSLQRWRTLAAAALLMFSVGVAWMAWTMVNRSSGPPARVTAAEFYQLKLDAGWKPAWVCRNDQEFADMFRTRLGQPLMIAALPAGLAAGGIDNGDIITPGDHSLAVLGSVDNQRILIVVTRREATFNPPSKMKNLNIFRRELGEYMMYEVTPINESRLLEYFYVPQA